MSRAASPAVVGGFVIGAIVLALASILVFGSGRLFQDRVTAVAYFTGNVRGLQEGSAVEFRGVRVGTVRAVRLVYDARDEAMRIPVYLEIDPRRLAVVGGSDALEGDGGEEDYRFLDALVAQGLRAQLELKSFVTGQLAVGLDMHPDTPVRRVGADLRYELPTVPSALDRVSQALQELPLREVAEKLISALDHAERLIGAPELGETIVHVRDTAASAASLLRDLDQHVMPRANDTLGAYADLARRSDERLDRLATQVETTLAGLDRLSQSAEERLETLSSAATGTLERARAALDNAASLTAEDSRTRYNLDRTLEELAGAARALRIMAEYIEQNPDALIRGKGR